MYHLDRCILFYVLFNQPTLIKPQISYSSMTESNCNLPLDGTSTNQFMYPTLWKLHNLVNSTLTIYAVLICILYKADFIYI